MRFWDRQVAAARVVAVERVADLRPGAEALEVTVARVGEPDRPVAANDHVVGRVQPGAAVRIDDGLGNAAHTVDQANPGGPVETALLAHDEPAIRPEEHAVRVVRVVGDDGDRAVGEPEALDGDALTADRREIESVLVARIDRALVGVELRDEVQLRIVTEHLLETRVVSAERHVRYGGHAAALSGR